MLTFHSLCFVGELVGGSILVVCGIGGRLKDVHGPQTSAVVCPTEGNVAGDVALAVVAAGAVVGLAVDAANVVEVEGVPAPALIPSLHSRVLVLVHEAGGNAVLRAGLGEVIQRLVQVVVGVHHLVQ